MAKKLSKGKKIAFSTIAVSITIFFACLLYLATIAWRTVGIGHSENRWSDNVFKYDAKYGYSPIPHKKVFHTLETGEKIPVVFDENGIRMNEEKKEQHSDKKGKILFLGCSFTHGYGVPSEKTFSALVGEKLGMEAFNAGIPGWGLAQIQLKAEELIPLLRPDITIVQYAKWLPERSVELYAPFNIGHIPTPYYSMNEKKEIQICPPVFQPIVYELPLLEVRNMSFPKLFFSIGIKMIPYDDYHGAKANLKILTGFLPAPAKNKIQTITHAYSEIQKICDQYNSRLLILRLYGSPKDIEEELNFGSASQVIDTYNALMSQLPEKNEKAWKQVYCFTTADGKVIDSHPNQAAHLIIAEEIVKALNIQTNALK